MGFFNDLTKKTSETTSKIAKKTSETTSRLAKETKLRMKISDAKGKIDDIYEEIGKNVYENHVKEIQNLDSIIEDNCKKIDELSEQIKNHRNEILVLRNRKTCKKCFEEIDYDAAFCPKCGAKQPKEKTVFEKAEEKIKEAEVLPKDEEKKIAVETELKEKTDKTKK